MTDSYQRLIWRQIETGKGPFWRGKCPTSMTDKPPFELALQRYGSTPMGTFGRLTVGDWDCYTVERPWLDNKPRVSCIPVGSYRLRQRSSGVVTRASGGRYTSGWEVCDVPGRTYIMLHPGNTLDDLEGCIAPGLHLGVVGCKWAVIRSRDAFDELMSRLDGQSEWVIRIA